MTATDPVQAVAQAIHEHDANASMSGAPWPTWDELSDDGRAAYGYVAEAAVAAARPAIEREAKAEAWDEGFTRGFYDVLAGGDRDASESAATNPYDRQETDDD